MKSDQRHELQRNDLASGLTDLPGLWRRYGNQVLIVLAVAFLVLAAVRYKRSQAVVRQQQTQAALASAWNGVEQMNQFTSPQASPVADAGRTALENDINQAAQAVIDDTDAPPALRGQAWLARGELYWQLAHAPVKATPAPTTQVTTQAASQPAAKSPTDYLDLAANAYGKIVSEYAEQIVPVTVARFSLAATAEERRDLSTARTQYKALIETPGLSPIDKTMAENRLAKLDTLERPTLLLPASQPAERSGAEMLQSLSGPTAPLRMGPAAPATSQPATQPR